MGRTQNTLRSETTRKALESEKFRKFPRLKQARILFRDNPLVYRDVEDARGSLRYLAGKSGSHGRNNMGKYAGLIEVEDRPRNPYNLPASDETIYEPFILNGHKRIAVLSDVHVPYHSMSALTAVLDFCKKDKPDAILWNGDILDCFQLSRFVKDRRVKSDAGLTWHI
jgi:Calcineurin-like phosphoesterase